MTTNDIVAPVLEILENLVMRCVILTCMNRDYGLRASLNHFPVNAESMYLGYLAATTMNAEVDQSQSSPQA